MREEGDGLSRFLAETKFTDGALLLVDGRKRMDTMECTGIRTSSPMRVVQSCLKLGSVELTSWPCGSVDCDRTQIESLLEIALVK